ncbi:MAG: aminoglycoside phosphotransferase family protein [Dermatophilaceae bacterium]
MSTASLPAAWVEQVSRYPADRGPSGVDWLATVPRLVDEALSRWDLMSDGPPRTGRTALVLPVRRGSERLALKVAWPHPEGAHEALALSTWGGRAAVRLVAALPSQGVLLLERLDPERDLRGVDADEACLETGRLLRRLQVPAPPQLPRLAVYLEPHLERMTRRPAVPRRVVTRTRGLARELLAGPVPELLLHTDLHYENVLHGPQGWTAIDPKPVAGHPAFDIFPSVQNRVEEMGTGATFRWSVRRRVSLLARSAGIDEDEALAWTLLRAGVGVSWATVDPDPTRLTLCVALTKALDG